MSSSFTVPNTIFQTHFIYNYINIVSPLICSIYVKLPRSPPFQEISSLVVTLLAATQKLSLIRAYLAVTFDS
jgi:hypothetical protein